MFYCQDPLLIFLATVNILMEVKSVNIDRLQILWKINLHLRRQLASAVFFVHYACSTRGDGMRMKCQVHM